MWTTVHFWEKRTECIKYYVSGLRLQKCAILASLVLLLLSVALRTAAQVISDLVDMFMNEMWCLCPIYLSIYTPIHLFIYLLSHCCLRSAFSSPSNTFTFDCKKTKLQWFTGCKNSSYCKRFTVGREKSYLTFCCYLNSEITRKTNVYADLLFHKHIL